MADHYPNSRISVFKGFLDNYYQKGIEINKTTNEERDPMAPATQARNNAQTGIKPKSY
jgi:hypothetical protein